MFDKPNQRVFYINILLAVFGIIVILFSDFIVIGLLFVISAVLLISDQIRQNKLSFTIPRVEKKLIIYDTDGSKATQTVHQKTIANHASNSEFWFKHIPAIGSVSNFRINGNPPAEQKREDGHFHVCMKFPPDLKATEEFSMTLSHDYQDAFKNTEGMLCYVVDNDTKLIQLVVELPEGRPVTTARVFCRQNGVDQPLLPPVITGQTRIETKITDPKLGAEYCLQWEWPKEGIVSKVGHLFKFG